MSNEEFVRRAYEVAEVKDIPGWIACFSPDGVFVDESVGVTYTGPDEVAEPVENYGRAFSDMHRELYDVYVSGDVVIVELALQGTHDGPLWLPQGILPPTGNRMDAPCCGVFRHVCLQIGNSPVVDGTAAFVQSLEDFARSVAGFGHTMRSVWSDRNASIAELEVHYTRLDGREVTLPCCNVFRLPDGLVADYRVYMDINPVYE